MGALHHHITMLWTLFFGLNTVALSAKYGHCYARIWRTHTHTHTHTSIQFVRNKSDTPRPFFNHFYMSPPPTILKEITLIANVYVLSYVLPSGSLQTCAVIEWFSFSFLYVFFFFFRVFG